MNNKFKVGETYATRSICNRDCIFQGKVIKRTAKTVTIRIDGKLSVKRICMFNGVEYIKPLGNYSFAPIFNANETLSTLRG